MKRIYSLLSLLLVKTKLHLIKSLCYTDREPLFNTAHLDYVKVGLLELFAKEIYERNINGAVAELGVYKGGFAKYINQAFPDKQFYLFDTFEGFDGNDISKEKELGFKNTEQDFSDTSIDMVLSKMQYKQQCVIKKGRFPDSSSGLEDMSFCFVSIDADLYEPIYQGLKFFYPRLLPGGYIIVDDYNNSLYKGAKEAIRRFCTEEKISFIPIPDIGGGVIISKP